MTKLGSILTDIFHVKEMVMVVETQYHCATGNENNMAVRLCAHFHFVSEWQNFLLHSDCIINITYIVLGIFYADRRYRSTICKTMLKIILL